MTTSALLERDIQELAFIEAEQLRRAQRARWLKDPELWSKERLGRVLWSGQVRLMASVRDNRRTAAPTCHEVGKSFSAATLAAWWIDCHEPGEAFVVTSAPTNNQVRAILWREIGRAHAAGNLPGHVNQTEWQMTMPAGNVEIVAMGRKPDEFNPTAFQGIHARYVLVIFDEADGIPASLWIAADAVGANDLSKFLAIGNPDNPSSEFAQNCKPGSGWNVVTISAFDSPNLTGEPMPQVVLDQLVGRTYVEERRKRWAPKWYWVDEHGKPCDVSVGRKVVPPVTESYTYLKALDDVHPFWCSKVLGIFPNRADAGGLIPLSYIKAAQLRSLEPEGPNELGQDVGAGGDSSTVAHRRGPVVRVLSEDKNPNTMETCGNLIALMRKTGAKKAKVDMIGIGRGVVDRANEVIRSEKYDFIVCGVNVGEGAVAPPTDVDAPDDSEGFANLRAQLWWSVRDRFERGEIDIDPDDEDLAAELVEIKYKRTSTGKIQIESKDDAKRRGIPSPNRADAVMLSFAPGGVEEDTSLTW